MQPYKIFIKFLNIIQLLSKKKIAYFSPNYSKVTAVKSKFGFWYVGDVLNAHDIAYGIVNNGVVEENETDLIMTLLDSLKKEKSKVYFYDIGANTGWYGVLAVYLGKGRVISYSFEPVKEYFNQLKEAIYLNRLEQLVFPYNIALGDKKLKKEIYISGTGSSLVKEYTGETSSRLIEVEKIDDLVTNNQISKPDFIKIDAECFELEILKGGEGAIRECLPILFVEIISSLEGIEFKNKKYDETFALLVDMNYEIYCLEGNKLRKVDNTYKKKGPNMFLCLNKNKHAKEKGIVASRIK